MKPPSIETFDWRCFSCGFPQSVPIKPGWDNPVYVMEMERVHKVFLDHIGCMEVELMDLAEECVDAGVKPEILRRADELKAMLNAWRKALGDG